jgi:hydrophobic/amphiphilic exporter-1 (mainly G- bacteria), HAE1 family
VTLSDVSIRRPVLTWMLVLALLTFGVLGYSRLGVDQYPDLEFPIVTVDATLEGASPEGIEEDVTDLLEERLNTIGNVRTLRSTSYQGIARVEVEFELGTDLDVAIQDVRDQVAVARQRLPKETETTVTRLDNSSWAVVYAPLYSQMPAVEVTRYIDDHVKPLLETIPGVASVSIFGGEERNIRIWLDADAMRARGIAASDLLAALRREHVEAPGGIVEGSRLEWSVTTAAEFDSVEALEGMVVSHAGAVPVYLRDVARVEDGTEDVRSVTRFNGQPAVVIGVSKQSDANTVAVTNEVYRRLDALRPLLPDGIRIVETGGFIDFSLSIREAVDETLFALLFGGVLAVFVVFVFLRRTRPTLIVAAAIPLSVIATFGLVWLCGYTLNTMTLLGLTLAIGVVIDDAIIVLENIERHRESGKDAVQAAAEGTRQITFAAAAATFSVAAVFIPVAFAEGLLGSFLGEFGLTVAGSVVISLFVALTLTPMLAARMPPPSERTHGSVYHRLERGFVRLEETYRRVLDWSLAHRLKTAGLALLSFLAALWFGSQLGAEFFPPSDSGLIFTRFETPAGTSLEATAEILQQDFAYFQGLPELGGAFANIGGSSSAQVGRPNAGVITVRLVPREQRQRTTHDIVRDAREKMERIPGQQVRVMDPSGSFSSTEAFEVQILGHLSLEELDRYATRLMERLEESGGFVGLDKSLKVGLPEVRVIPDREKAAALGIDAATVAQVVQLMIGGLDVGVFKDAGSRYDIRMRLSRGDRDTPEAIRDLSVRTRTGESVALRNLVRLETGATASEITRVARQRAVSVSGNLDGLVLADAVERARRFAEEILPENATLRVAGDAEGMEEAGRQFALMLLLAILVIYMVLAAQFESFLQPLSVMLALPFSMVGALGGLWAMGMTLNLFSMIGIILLVGLVTKNSILLVDYANQLRAEGVEKVEAMRTAAPVRMRPVLMTALSMIFGVLPAAVGIGPGSETRAPMAVATGAGMFSSMLLTLLVVPVFYLALDDLKELAMGLPARWRARRDAGIPARQAS